METQNSPDGGGTQPFCAISPADMVGIVENFMSRIQALETAVSQLMASNISAVQLSDISQNVGSVYNVVYMGTGGWTLTEAGTLIPPQGVSLSTLGFTMSDGNTYPIVSVDSDGVLNFGVSNTGQTGGTSGGGGALKFATLYESGSETIADNVQTTLTLDTLVASAGSIGSVSSPYFTLSQNGSYLVNASIHVQGMGGGTIDTNGDIIFKLLAPAPGTNTTYHMLLNSEAGPDLVQADIPLVSCIQGIISTPFDLGVSVYNHSGDTLEAWINNFTVIKLA